MAFFWCWFSLENWFHRLKCSTTGSQKKKVSSSKKCHSEIMYRKDRIFRCFGSPFDSITKHKPPLVSSLRKPWHTRWLQRHRRGQSRWSSAVSWLALTSSSSRREWCPPTDYKDFRVGKEMAKSIFCKIIVSSHIPSTSLNQCIQISLKDISANYTWMRCWCESFPIEFHPVSLWSIHSLSLTISWAIACCSIPTLRRGYYLWGQDWYCPWWSE